MGLFNFKKPNKAATPKTVSIKPTVGAVIKAKTGADLKNAARPGWDVLIKPIITEKALGLEATRNYVFEVKGSATKPAIKMAVEGLFGVNVEKVNVLNNKSRNKFLKGKWGTQTGFKKAIIRIKTGQKIEALKS
ncbi:MAG: 50S ribosomal protein L23 [Patescibacteria group bacterium]